MKRKLVSLVLAFAFALSLGAVNTAVPSAVAATGATLQSTTSVDSSPAFRQYLKNVKAGKVGKNSGVLPSLNTPAEPISLSRGFSEAAAPPAYDPRNLQGTTNNYLPEIKNQAETGCCWAFGATGCVDILDSLAKNTPVPPYSEEHMRFSLSKQNPAPVDAAYGRKADQGGNFVLASSYMTNWAGMVLQSDAPYPPAPSTGESWPAAKMSKPVAKHVTGTASIPMNATAMKAAIMQYGAINVSINGGTLTDTTYNPSTYAAYGTSTTLENAHSVDLVGWNDNFPTTNFNVPRPTSNGAWLLRNSWGTSAGQNGYYWLSYQDASLKSTNFNQAYYAVTQDRALKTGETMLSNDHLPMEARVSLGTTKQYVANTYQMTAFTTVSDVMLYSASVGATYSIYIVPATSAGLPSVAPGSLKNPVATGTILQEGYLTKTLSYPYVVPATGKYAVVVAYNLSSASNPGLVEELGWTYPGSPNVASTGTAKIGTGESSYSSGSTWTDLYADAKAMSAASSDSVTKVTFGNFCIRAITQAPAAPSKTSLVSLANAATGPTLTWTRSKGASGYYVYRKAAGATSWSKIKTITSGATLSYADTTAVSGTTYTYTEKAYLGTSPAMVSSYDVAGKTITYVAQPKLVSAVNAATSVKLTWAKTPGVTGYIIYRRTNGAQGVKVKTVTSASTVSYTDTAVSTGNTYTYLVRAYKTNTSTVSSYDSAGKKIVFVAMPKLTSLKNSKSGPVLKWGKITGATGYLIYRRVPGGAWSKIKTVTSVNTLTYTDTGATNKKTYYYTIQAYKTSSANRSTNAPTGWKITVKK